MDLYVEATQIDMTQPTKSFDGVCADWEANIAQHHPKAF